MAAPTLRDILPPSPEQLQQQIIGDNQLYRGFVSGVKGITSGSIANDALNAESAGAAEANALRERALASQQAAGAYAPRVQSLRNVNGVGDAFDFAAGAIGQGVASMAPTLGAALALRAPGLGALGTRALPYAGAVGAGYLQEKGEAALGQYSDPVLAAKPVEQRQAAATTKGLVNAALEGIVPAGLTSLAGKNSLGRILAKDAVTEGATEGVQQYVGHLANKSLDPNRELDPWDIADAVAAGALTGGTVGAAHGAAHTPKDFVARTAQSIQDAATTAPSPKDFLDKVFAPTPTEENDPVAAGDMHSDMIDAVSAAGDKAAEVLDSMTAKRDELAKKYAEEILNDPNTPAAVRSQVEAMGGDYTSPQNQATLGAHYVGRRAGEAASTAAEFVKAFTDRVTKKSLQTPVTPDEEFSLHKDIIDNLTPAAKRRTDIIRDIPQIASGVSGIINKMSQVGAAPTEKNIAELQQLYYAATTLFADPAKTLKQLSDKLEMKRADGKKITPFMDLLAGVTTAQQDVAKNEGGSYLQARLVTPMGQEQVAQLAKFVDEFGMTDMKNSKQADKVLDGLAVAFGGRQEALQVLDYYSKANKLNAKQLLQYDANTQLDAEDGKVLSADDIQDNPDDFNSGIREYDAKPTRTYSFADPKTNRPFRAAERLEKHNEASLRQGTVASDSAKVTRVPYSQYADETGKDHKAEVVRLMNDVKVRQDKAYAGYAAELGLKGTAEAKLAAARRYAAERRQSPDPKSTRLADIDRLQGELDMAREAYKGGGPKAVLDLYNVDAIEQNEKDNLTATDEEIKSMAPNKRQDPEGMTPEQRKELAQKVKDDTVAFTSQGGKKLTLSAEKMVLAQARKEKATGEAARGESGFVREQRLLKEAIASVIARGYTLEARTIPARQRSKELQPPSHPKTPDKTNTRVEPAGLPTLKRFSRSDDTKAALAEQEESVAALKKRLDAAVQEYEDVNDEDARDKTRTGIERNIARLQTQYEAAEGKAPLRAVIRQRQAVYKEALAAINDVDFQEKVDAEERGEETKKGARTFDETTGEQLGAYGDLKKPTRSGVGAESVFGDAFNYGDVRNAFFNIVRRTVGDIVRVVVDEHRDQATRAAEFDFDAVGKPYIRAYVGMFDEATTPEIAAHHEAAHVVVQIIQQTEGKDVAKQVVDLANQKYIREQVTEWTGFTAGYFLTSPEELFVQAYAMWATGNLTLKSEPVLTKVFNAVKAFITGMKQDAALASLFAAIDGGQFAKNYVKLDKAALSERLDNSGSDFFTYGENFKPAPKDIRFVMDTLGLTSKDIDVSKLQANREAFWMLNGVAHMLNGDVVSDEVVEVVQGLINNGGVAPDRFFKNSLQGVGVPSEAAIDAVYDVAVNENYGRIDTPAKALAFARHAKRVSQYLEGISFDQLEAMDEARSFKLMDLRNTLEDMFKQDGYSSYDWHSLFDNEGSKEDLAEMDRIVGGSNVDPKATLPQKSSYAAKDQAKWDKANKFIGRGSQYSSTNAYAKAIGPTRANTGVYEASDVVFVSAEGARTGRISPDFVELKRATDAGATIVADNQYGRERSYNIGEREVAAFLARQGYQEKFGVWTKPAKQSKLNGVAPDRIFKKSLQGVGVPSDKLIDAVYDVVHNENYSRLDTPEKALAFARAAKQVLEHLNKTSYTDREAKYGEDRSDELVGLRNSLEEMFNQSGYVSFDWHSLFDGQGTAADRAAMDEIVKQNKQDKQDPSKNNHVPTTEQEVLDEIARIRGKDVAVAFETFAGIGGSGEFSMDKDKTNRLIRIALDAANMKSVAWHESLHDFIAMLGGTPEERKIKRDMLQATNTPAINARLRELLKDHPEALKQLDDPEERLAYVYQFWAEGVLQLTPKGDTLMGKVAKLFRDLLGIMSSDAKLEQYLIALHSGQLTDPSTVAQVIEKLDAKTLGDKLESIAGPLADGLSRVFTSATDRLRKHGIAELDELADLFHKDPGHEKGRAGMLQRRAQKEGQFSNAFEKLLEGTTARQRLDALENLQAMRAPSNDLEKGIASLLSNLHTYMLGAGVKTLDTKTGQWHDIRRVTNYFPRNWDADSIRKDEAGFKALLAKNGVPSDQVKAIYDTLAFNGGSTDLMENAKSLGFVPLAVHVNDRALTFINSTNAQYFAKYQNKDLTDIMTTYIRQAAHRAEYTRSFGNDGHVISDLLKRAQANGLTNAEEEALIPTIQGLEGTLGHDMNPTLKKAMAGVLTVENVLLMPMAIFSQMIDPVNIAMRTNQVKDAGAAYLRALKDLKKFVTRDKTVDYDRELTKMLGIISTDSMLETMGQTQGSMYMTKTMRDVNKQFFRYNGMEGWNNSMRIAATVAGEQYILANVGNSRAMEELNVDPKNVITLPQGTKFGEPGRMAVSLEQFESTGMSKADAMKAAAQIQEAMFRFVDGAVVRPNAAHRATWMSDPRFQLISHLKQFTYSFQSAVLARAKNEHLHGNSLPMMYLAASVPIMFASDMAKWVLTGTVPKNWTFFDYFTHAVARSGVLGKYEYSVKAAEDAARGNVPGISFAGPAVEHANILAQWIAGAPGSSTDKLIDRSIPLARYA